MGCASWRSDRCMATTPRPARRARPDLPSNTAGPDRFLPRPDLQIEHISKRLEVLSASSALARLPSRVVGNGVPEVSVAPRAAKGEIRLAILRGRREGGVVDLTHARGVSAQVLRKLVDHGGTGLRSQTVGADRLHAVAALAPGAHREVGATVRVASSVPYVLVQGFVGLPTVASTRC